MLKLLRRFGGIFVFVSTLWFIMATPLLAEDIAHRRIIGFSPDGNYFAFEQSGIENGSGSAYAHIFLIDTRENKWVKGSPFRARADGRGKLRRARQRVRRDARRILQRYRVHKKRRRAGQQSDHRAEQRSPQGECSHKTDHQKT